MHGRWASEQKYKIGVKKDGTLTAVQLDAVTNIGAYRKQSGNLSGTDFYQIPNFRKVIKPVHTNTVVGADYRAPAYPQSVFGFASFLDQIAYELGVNPLDMFLRNRIQKYKSKIPFTSNYLEECIIEGSKHIGWNDKWHKPGAVGDVKKHGIGMALGGYPFRPGMGAATIRLNPDGTAHVLVGVTDIGTGAKSTMAIIAAELWASRQSNSTYQWRYRRDALLGGRVRQPDHAIHRSGGIAAAEDVRRRVRPCRRTAKGEAGRAGFARRTSFREVQSRAETSA